MIAKSLQPFVLKFRTLSGEIVDLDFSGKLLPFGFHFASAFRLASTNMVDEVKPGSTCDEFGVKVGWCLVQVNDTEVENFSHGELLDTISRELREWQRSALIQ